MSARSDHERRLARRVATLLVAIFVALCAARLILAFGMGLSNEYTGSSEHLSDLVFSLVAIVGAGGLFVVVGWAIVTRQPRNAIGWLLFSVPLTGILSLFVGDYATEALARRRGPCHSASQPRGSIAGSSS
jgi:hypothetical protein